MTGIDAPYEAPESPEIHLDAGNTSADLLADQVVESLVRAGKIPAS
jgi:bifunctional enzyme CysN/CysC